MLDKKTILEGNILIAQYMGGYLKTGIAGKQLISFQDGIVQASSLRYHRSWNALMPVWIDILEKAKEYSEDCNNKDYVFFECHVKRYSIRLDFSLWSNKKWNNINICHSCYAFDEGKESEDLMECYWKTIVDFIKFKNRF